MKTDKNTILKYLRTLELPANKSVSEEELRSKFRKLAKKYHPDVASENDKDGKRFVEIKKAYDWLIKNIEYTNRQIASGFTACSTVQHKQERKPAAKPSKSAAKTAPPPDPKIIAKNFAEGIKRVEYSCVKYHSYIFTYGIKSEWGENGYEVYKRDRELEYGTLDEIKDNILFALNSEPGVKQGVEFGLDAQQRTMYNAAVKHMLSVTEKEYEENRKLRLQFARNPAILTQYSNAAHSIYEYNGCLYAAFTPKSSQGKKEERTWSIYKMTVEPQDEIRLSFDRYIKKGSAPFVDAEEMWTIKLITNRMVELEGVNRRVDCVLTSYGNPGKSWEECMHDSPRGICNKCGENRAILGMCLECRKHVIHGFRNWRILKDGSIFYTDGRSIELL